MSNSNYGERISRLEEKVNNIEEKVNELSDVKNVVTELALLSRQYIEQNKEFRKTQETLVQSYTELKTTLKTMNDNLTNINCEVKKANTRIGDLEVKVDALDNKSKVDIISLIVKAVPWFLGAGITYGIYKIVIEVMKL